MRERADETMRNVPRQLRVRIQRDDKADLRKDGQVSNLYREAVAGPSQKVVQLKQLATFPLPTHPYVLAGIEGAVPVEQEKRSNFGAGVLEIQIANQLRTISGKRFVVIEPLV